LPEKQVQATRRTIVKESVMAGSNGVVSRNGQQVGAETLQGPEGGEAAMTASNQLTDLGMRIFLDRYALKDPTKATLKAGDRVLVVANHDTGQRELGVVEAVVGNEVRVVLEDGAVLTRSRSSVDKPVEQHPEEMMERVARGIASVEAPQKREELEQEFRWLLDGFKFVPGGRILAAAGTDQRLSFYNCFVVPSPRDSRAGIVKTLSQMMEIMSRGGGVGINVSSLRPRYAYVAGVNGRSSGSVSWGALYSFVTGLIEQGGSRRGALMLILGCWHPDVEEFIRSKTVMGRITNANISVAVTDAFMEAVREDGDWDLEFPETSYPDFENLWDGNLDAWKKAGRPVHVYRTVKARDLWDTIIKSAWASAEPGLYFIDRANKMSNSWYYPEGYLICTNPCGEQPLSPFAVCNLGALNLAKFAKEGKVYWAELSRATRAAVRFLDNVIDATPYFLDENKNQQLSERRIGLGVMGLAEMLIRLDLRYGSDPSVEFIDKLFEFLAHEAYLASAEIAAEKGAFPKFDAEKFLESGYMQAMPEDVRTAVAHNGIRNVTLLTVAPTGTTGTMVNTSTGVEPFFFWSFLRNSRLGTHEERVAVAEDWQEAHPEQKLPEHFVTAMDLEPEDHVRVQAAVQRWVDSAISKTCNVPESYTVEQTRKLYELMYKLGSKGGTVYRDNSRDTQVLELKKEDKQKEKAAALPMPKIRPRPYKRHGVTASVQTPAGTSHITMNDDDAGLPFEIFLEIGKAGSDLKAMAEAMGRLMSLVLRIASPLTPAERIEQIVTQLWGIGGARSYGFGKNRVLSFPDAVAHALAEHYGVHVPGNGFGAEPVEDGPTEGPKQLSLPQATVGDLCPSCGNSTFVREAGCVRCYACGHSEC
jgi:ribonucleoside-diphosphate reductase alpha chain